MARYGCRGMEPEESIQCAQGAQTVCVRLGLGQWDHNPIARKQAWKAVRILWILISDCSFAHLTRRNRVLWSIHFGQDQMLASVFSLRSYVSLISLVRRFFFPVSPNLCHRKEMWFDKSITSGAGNSWLSSDPWWFQTIDEFRYFTRGDPKKMLSELWQGNLELWGGVSGHRNRRI